MTKGVRESGRSFYESIPKVTNSMEASCGCVEASCISTEASYVSIEPP